MMSFIEVSWVSGMFVSFFVFVCICVFRFFKGIVKFMSLMLVVFVLFIYFLVRV